MRKYLLIRLLFFPLVFILHLFKFNLYTKKNLISYFIQAKLFLLLTSFQWRALRQQQALHQELTFSLNLTGQPPRAFPCKKGIFANSALTL